MMWSTAYVEEEEYSFFVLNDNDTVIYSALEVAKDIIYKNHITARVQTTFQPIQGYSKIDAEKTKPSKEKMFRCDKCSFESKTKQQLKKHVQSYNYKKSHLRCAECSYVTGTSTDLIKHLSKIHMNYSFQYFDPDDNSYIN